MKNEKGLVGYGWCKHCNKGISSDCNSCCEMLELEGNLRKNSAFNNISYEEGKKEGREGMIREIEAEVEKEKNIPNSKRDWSYDVPDIDLWWGKIKKKLEEELKDEE